MRNATLLLLGLLFGVGGLQAQTLLPSLAWRINGGATYWFPSSGDVVRGAALNPATDHLLVVSRRGGTNVVVVDAATGDSLAALDMTGVASSNGFFKLTEIGATADGQIFATGLSLNNTNPIQLFRWANEGAPAEIVYSGPIGAGRWGDGFGVGGTGTDVELYLSGSGNDQIAVFDYDGTAATLRSTYLVPDPGTDRARYGLAAVPGQDSLWINEPGSAIAKISVSTGQIGREIPDALVPAGFADLTYFERMGRQYLGTGVRFQGTPSEYFAVVDITTPGQEFIAFITPALGTTANGNAAGFVAYDATSDRLVVGSTNNAIAAFDLSGFTAYEAMLSGLNETTPLQLSATGRVNVAVAGDTVTVSGRFEGLTSAATGAHLHIGGVGVNGPVAIPLSFVNPNASTTRASFNAVLDLGATPPSGISADAFIASLASGDVYVNVHSTDHPSGEIRGQLLPPGNTAPTAPVIAVPASMATVTLAGRADAPVTIRWTASTDAEGHAVSYLWQLGTSASLSAGSTVRLVRSSDTTFTLGTVADVRALLTGSFGLAPGDSIALYHRAFASDGSLVATGTTATAYFKLGRLHIADAVWEVKPSAGGFFRSDNNTRGGGYNPTTDHVIAVSRSGGLKVVALDAATGDSVGVLSVAGVSGGTFPLSEIGITEDGQIFGANLSVSPAASAVKVYRWENEFAAPTLVFESLALEGPRYGDSFGVMGSGSDVTLFLTGSGNERVAVLKPDTDGMFMLDDYLVPEAGEPRARGGIAASATMDSIWVKSPTHALAKVSVASGGRRDIPTSVVAVGYSDLASVAVPATGSTQAYLLTGVRFQGAENFALVDVSMPGAETVVGVTDTLGTSANGNATGFAAFDVRNGRLVVASTNNAIASFASPVTVTLDAIASNALPMPASITSPADGASLTLEGGANSAFTAAWSAGSDDGGSVSYRWQLSTSSNFAGALVVDAEVGTDTEFTTSFGVVDSLLAVAGVAAGGTATVYHRVITTDGTNYAASNIASVTLTRGLLVGTEDTGTLPAAFRLLGNAPNPVQQTTALRLDLPTQAEVTVRVYDLMGRNVMTQTAALAAGTGRVLMIDGAPLAAGVYVYRVEAIMEDRTEVQQSRFTVVR